MRIPSLVNKRVSRAISFQTECLCVSFVIFEILLKDRLYEIYAGFYRFAGRLDEHEISVVEMDSSNDEFLQATVANLVANRKKG